MATAAELKVVLSAADNMSGVLKSAGGGFKDLESTALSAGKALAGIATAAVIGGVGALAAGLGVAVKSAADFESQMSAIKAVSGASGQQIDQLRGLVLQLGADTSFSATEAGQGVEELIKAGVSVADVMGGGAAAALNLAAAGAVTVGEAAVITSNSLNAFGLSGTEAAHVADVLAGASVASASDVHSLGFGLAAVGAVAHAVGADFDDTITALSVLAQAGLKGSDAGTSLKTTLLSLHPTTAKQIALFDELGITTNGMNNKFYDSEGRFAGVANMAQVLKDATKGMTREQQLATLEIIGGTDAVRAMAIFMDQGAAGVDKMATSIEGISAADVAATRLDNLEGSLEKMKGSLSTAAIAVGTAFLPALRAMVDGVTGFVNDNMTQIEGFAVAFAGALSSIDFGGILTLVSGAFAAVGTAIQTGLQVGTDALYAAGQAVATWASTVGAQVPGIGPIIEAAGAVAGSALTGLAAIMRGDINGAMAAFTQSAIDAGPAMDAIASSASVLQSSLAPLVPVIAGIAAAFAAFTILTTIVGWIAALAGAWAGLSATFAASSGIIAGIVAILGGPITVAILAVAAVIGVLTAAWIGNWGNIQGATASAASAIGSAIQGIGQFFNELGSAATELGSTVAAAWDALPGSAAAAWNAVVSAVQSAWDAITSTISSAGAALQEAAQAAWDGVLSTIQSALDAIGAAVQAGWEAALTEETRAALANLAAVVGEAWSLVTELISAAMATIGSAVSAGWAVVTSAVDAAMAAVSGVVTAGWAVVTEAVSAAMTAISAVVTAGWTTLSGIVTTALDAITAAVSAGWAAAVAATEAALAGVVAAIQQKFAEAVAAVSSAMAQVVAAVQGAAGAAASAGASVGSSIVEGLRGALNAGISSIANAAASLVSSAIGAARAAADSHSPSKKTEELGKDLVEGLRAGLGDADGLFDEIIAQFGDFIDAAREYRGVAENILQIEEDTKSFRADAQIEAIRREWEMVDVVSEHLRLKRDLIAAERDLLPARQAAANADRQIEDITRGSLGQRQELIKIEGERKQIKLAELDLEEKLVGLKSDSAPAKAIKLELDALRDKDRILGIQADRIKTTNDLAATGAKVQREALIEAVRNGEAALVPGQQMVALLEAEIAVWKADEAVVANVTKNFVNSQALRIQALKDESLATADRIAAGTALVDKLTAEGLISETTAGKLNGLAQAALTGKGTAGEFYNAINLLIGAMGGESGAALDATTKVATLGTTSGATAGVIDTALKPALTTTTDALDTGLTPAVITTTNAIVEQLDPAMQAQIETARQSVEANNAEMMKLHELMDQVGDTTVAIETLNETPPEIDVTSVDAATKSMDKARKAAEKLAEALDDLDKNTSSNAKSDFEKAKGKGINTSPNVNMDFFAHGGIVPGSIGEPRLAMVHGGEMILNPQQQRSMLSNDYMSGALSGSSGGSTAAGITIQVNAPIYGVNDMESVVIDALERAGRRGRI